jgi:hypothetical protein
MRPRTATPHGRQAAHAHAATPAQSTLGQHHTPTQREARRRDAHTRASTKTKDQSQAPPPFKRPLNPRAQHHAHAPTHPHQHARPGCVARLPPSLADQAGLAWAVHRQGTHSRTHAGCCCAPLLWLCAVYWGMREPMPACIGTAPWGRASISAHGDPPPPPGRGPTRARCKGLRPTPALPDLVPLRWSRAAVVGSWASPRWFFSCRGFRLVRIHDSYSSGRVNTVPGGSSGVRRVCGETCGGGEVVGGGDWPRGCGGGGARVVASGGP